MAEVNPAELPEAQGARDGDRERFVDAVVQMTKLTQEGKMRWESMPGRSGRLAPGWQLFRPTGECEYKEERFQSLYKGTRFVLSRLTMRGGDGLAGLPAFARHGGEVSYSLSIVDGNDATLFTFPPVEALRGLHSSIQDQLANVDELIQKLFDE